jgi:hypothetical protein
VVKPTRRCHLEDIQVEHILAAEALATAIAHLRYSARMGISVQVLQELLVAQAAIQQARAIVTSLHPQGEHHDTSN